jgi:hypothetical protein
MTGAVHSAEFYFQQIAKNRAVFLRAESPESHEYLRECETEFEIILGCLSGYQLINAQN